MADWRDNLFPAFYAVTSNGRELRAEFKVRGHEYAGGRGKAIDQSPGSDIPLIEDTGEIPSRFSLECYLVGDDYMAARDLLITALRSKPDGEVALLSHPYLGQLEVVALQFRLRETNDRGRTCSILVDFVRARDRTPPRVFATPTQRVDSAVEATVSSASETIVEALRVKGVPQEVIDAASIEVEKAGNALAKIGAIPGLVDRAAELSRSAQDLIRNAQNLVLEPIALAEKLRLAYEQAEDVLGNAADSLSAYSQLEALIPDSWRTSRENDNARAVNSAARRHALARWARALLEAEWKSFEDATLARERFLDRLDDQVLVVSREHYAALRDLRAAVASAVPPRDQDLPRLRTIEIPTVTPALLLAFRLYGDRGRWAEITDRNGVRMPLFVPGKTPLEVLSS